MESAKAILSPDRLVELDGGITAHVYPMGLRHLTKFSSKIVSVLGAIGAAVPAGKVTNDTLFDAIAGRATPFLMSDLLDLIAECVRFEPSEVKIESLPHWDLPVIIEAWVDVNFGEERKRRPWVTAIEALVTKATRKPFSLRALISGTGSSSSSQADTASKTSSTAPSPDSLTPAGA